MKINQLSENSVLILFEQTTAPTNFQKVLLLVDAIDDASIHQESWQGIIVERVPSYASIYLQFNRQKITSAELTARIQRLYNALSFSKSSYTSTSRQQHHIPVFYDAEVAPDLHYVADYHQLSVDEVIRCHCEQVYDVYAIGFAPGFAYLGVVNEKIQTPRKATPRLQVPKGSVAIAEQQTSIYPTQTPGGWQIIGHSPLFLSMSDEALLSLFSVGDQVTFNPITRDEFLLLNKQYAMAKEGECR